MTPLNPVIRLGLLGVAWIVWILPAITPAMRNREKAIRIDPRARWGLLLESAGYFVACTHGPAVWAAGLALWRAAAGSAFALGAIFLFRSAVWNLGRQWRFDAALNREHELVQTGAYRLVRHPIYASMFGMLLATVFWVGTLPGWPVAIGLFILGTEIRVRVEDGLLRERFGERFVQWQNSTPAYLPLVR
jgi:protein-S-isoprenylcysteine O-methyltransferase Ste14